ncbi:MAG: hypothetical protein PUB32_03765 [Clostridiales bacterium]|nr:hypothetical protein [Clostridiales bacterium]
MRNYTYVDGGVLIKSKANMAEQYGIGQYRYPLNYELAGQTITAVAGDKEYTLDFKCKVNVLFNGMLTPYECIKCAPDLYFVRVGFDVAVIDKKNSAVTLIVEGDYVMATIKGTEGAVAHTWAGDEMVGTNVRWVLGCGRYVNQEFVSEDKVKAAWAPRDGKVAENPYKAVKIGGPYYLVDMKSDILKDVCAPFFTDHVIMVQDYDRCMAFGCVFGKGFDPIMITGYAKFL